MSSGALPAHRGRAHETRLVGEEPSGEAGDQARDRIGDQTVAERLEPDRLHARLVLARAGQHPADAAMEPAIADAAKGARAVLLANHGPVVSGRTLDDAVYAAEELEEVAQYLDGRRETQRSTAARAGAETLPEQMRKAAEYFHANKGDGALAFAAEIRAAWDELKAAMREAGFSKSKVRKGAKVKA